MTIELPADIVWLDADAMTRWQETAAQFVAPRQWAQYGNEVNCVEVAGG